MTAEQVQAKLALLATAIARLRVLPQSSCEEFTADDRNVDAALRRLQIAIQILIDVGSHVVSRLGLGTPDTSQDLLEKLERAGHLQPGEAARFGKMFAFRNRIVELYERVDDAVVFEIVTKHLDDLEALAMRYIDALATAP